MRFAMEMKDRVCPPHLGKDRCLVFELLKGHFCLQDSAMGVGSTRESVLPGYVLVLVASRTGSSSLLLLLRHREPSE